MKTIQVLLSLTVAINAVVIGKDKWTPLTDLLKNWEFTEDFAVSVGTAEEG